MKNQKQNICLTCGKCCKSNIPLTIYDISQISDYLNIEAKEIFNTIVQKNSFTASNLFLMQKGKNGSCAFLNSENLCKIHSVKPKACKIFYCNNVNCISTFAKNENSIELDNKFLRDNAIDIQITQKYIELNSCKWNENDFKKAIESIKNNISFGKTSSQKIKIGKINRNKIACVNYDCSKCPKPGECAVETPITLEDIRRIKNKLKITYRTFFMKYISPEICNLTNGLKLLKFKRCNFFNKDNIGMKNKIICGIEEVRPMHCRFTSCPIRIESSDLADSFYLNSGTPDEQYFHQVSLHATRKYVEKYGVKYNKNGVVYFLDMINKLKSNSKEKDNFINKISAYRI